MTTTTQHTAVAVGTAGAAGQDPQKLTLQAGTTGVMLIATLTNGNSALKSNESVKVFFATSPDSITAAASVDQLALCAETLIVKPDSRPNKAKTSKSEFELNAGGYLYSWLEWGAQDAAGAITVKVTEFP